MAECRFGMSFTLAIAQRPCQGHRLLQFIANARFDVFCSICQGIFVILYHKGFSDTEKNTHAIAKKYPYYVMIYVYKKYNNINEHFQATNLHI